MTNTRLPALWVIDADDIVHTHRCHGIEGTDTDYFSPSRTAHDLIEHLARPDIKDGRHHPSNLIYCEDCIGTMAEIESAK
jgi:hypothetical protein